MSMSRLAWLVLSVALAVMTRSEVHATRLAFLTYEAMSHESDFVLIGEIELLKMGDCEAYGECVELKIAFSHLYGLYDPSTDYSSTIAVASFGNVEVGDKLAVFGFNCGERGIGLLYSGSEIFVLGSPASGARVSANQERSESNRTLASAIQNLSERLLDSGPRLDLRDAACRWLERARIRG